MPASREAVAGAARPAGSAASPGRSRARFLIVAMLFVVSTLNNADRAILSITGTEIQDGIGISDITLGYLFSAFSWAYMLAQLPGGWIVDKWGARKVYAGSIFVWSVTTLLQGFVPLFGLASAMIALFVLRLAVGLAEGPAYPTNGRVVATWFPAAERATASAIFNSSQYAAPVVFTPFMAWLTHGWGWPSAYFVMGGIGIALSAWWWVAYRQPREHRGVNQAELDHLIEGGALVDIEKAASVGTKTGVSTCSVVRQLLSSRLMIGLCTGQFFIATLVYFFLTWFPIYLIKELGMPLLEAGFTASIPALFGFIGGILGGLLSDGLLRRGISVTAARKIPIVAGLALSTCIIACAWTSSKTVVIALMAIAFFGKGLGSLGWTVLSDTSPKEAAGLSGGLFNALANLAGITTPIIIGYVVDVTGSFDGALYFVGASGLAAALSFLLVVGRIERIQLKGAAQ
ncbi:MFS transporter [Streptomyces sp. NBC_01795]|uniref:MFS transporter n=1 Tax=unclassified Streptomyces TaxID=2593676 RepID=UPI002DD7B29B|nr:MULTISPECIES: MFS transporter [unclassified Streptomyces]WSA90126.1 MFS transporter [Streptomyces sp. NBC_01795]WSB74357.1 MFS transporter [Streptomyces sp. NBC_01775]WSS17262.1 MFS transporter [Streptomyces sp. NBC_01186]